MDVSKVQVTWNDNLELTMCTTAKRLAEVMKSDGAILLPVLYREFCDEVRNRASLLPHLSSTPDRDIPGIRWLLSWLNSLFGDSLQVHCKQDRYGSVLFHKDCDLVKALSTALGKCQTLQKQLNEQRVETQISKASTTECQLSMQEQVGNVAHHLNGKIHQQASQFIATYQNNPKQYTLLNLETLVSGCDPVLLDFIRQLTQIVCESRRKLFHDEKEKGTTKTVRQLYILCVLLFCTNSTCSMPLHVVLTEAILCHGGSLELVRIFNRIGAVASIDTNSRLATRIVQERLMHGIKPQLQPHMLSIISIDNIDILQPHALVSCTDKTRSWHGTSVQCVQPLPLSGTLSQEEVLRGNEAQKRQFSSPVASPMPVEKHKRRRRTLTEQPSPHTHMTQPRLQDSPIFLTDEYQAQCLPQMTIHHYRLNAVEKSSLECLRSDIHKVMLLKHMKPSNIGHLPGIPTLLNCVQKTAFDKEASNVAYVEIVSEKADSKHTLFNVLGRIQNTFVISLQQKWVVVVGDGKTYDLLQSIRSEYGSHLKWLVPFTGDWHILLNYQKTLMKVYGDAGLVQLGKVAGYRGETLTSLVNCSNFRRTHAFLLQSFEAFYCFFLSLYLSTCNSSTVDEINYEEKITSLILELITQFSSICGDDDVDRFRQTCNNLFTGELSSSYVDFLSCMEALSQQQDTINFWFQFVFYDCFAYLGLYTALRYRNWDIRNGSIKLMVAVFTALDRPLYQRLIPQHLKDLLTIPECIIRHLKNGGFSVRLTPSEWHAVALDECHEMKIQASHHQTK